MIREEGVQAASVVTRRWTRSATEASRRPSGTIGTPERPLSTKNYKINDKKRGEIENRGRIMEVWRMTEHSWIETRVNQNENTLSRRKREKGAEYEKKKKNENFLKKEEIVNSSENKTEKDEN
jgi:hypothetical protein